MTPLILAVREDSTPSVKFLIERKADLQAQDEKGCTVLHYAAKKKNDALFLQLFKAGANLNIQNFAIRFPVELTGYKGRKEEDKLIKVFQHFFINPLFLEFIRLLLSMSNDLLNIISEYVCLEKDDWESLIKFKNYQNLIKILNDLKQAALKNQQNNLLIKVPLPLSFNTPETEFFQILMRCILDKVPVEYTHNNENLFAKIDEKPAHNVSKYLFNNPDLGKITLSNTDLDICYQLIRDDPGLKKYYPEVIQRIPNNFESAEDEYGFDKNTLHLSEKIAIFCYTIATFPRVINLFLKTDGKLIPSLCPTIFLIIKLIWDALLKLPFRKEDEEVIRFFSYDDSKNMADLNTTGIHFEKGFWSSMRMSQIIKGTSAGHYENSISVCLIVNRARQGKYIAPYSIFKNEEEVLFLPGTKFRLKGGGTAQGRKFYLLEALPRNEDDLEGYLENELKLDQGLPKSNGVVTECISKTLFPVPPTQMSVVKQENSSSGSNESTVQSFW